VAKPLLDEMFQMKRSYVFRMWKLIWFLLAALVILLTGCSSEDPASNLPQGGQYFTVRVVSDTFVMYITDPTTIRLATENFQGKNRTFPSGRIESGGGGFNFPWNWHFVPESVRMVEAAIEVCDGRPSYVSEHVQDYVSVGYCPWAAKVIKVGK
jgi:hypothetical protein